MWLTLLARAIAADALTRRAVRADTQQGVDRVSDLAAVCLLFVGVGSVCVKRTGVGGIGEPTMLKQAEGAEPQQAARRCCLFGGGKDEHR